MTSDRRARLTEREEQALIARSDGRTYDDIAKTLGFGSRAGAFKAVARARNRMMTEGPSELRAVEFVRLERLHQAVWTQALAGDLDAVDAVLRISTRRMKLMGIDVPRIPAPMPGDDPRRSALHEAQITLLTQAMLAFAASAGLDTGTADTRRLMIDALRQVSEAAGGDDEHEIIEGSLAHG